MCTTRVRVRERTSIRRTPHTRTHAHTHTLSFSLSLIHTPNTLTNTQTHTSTLFYARYLRLLDSADIFKQAGEAHLIIEYPAWHLSYSRMEEEKDRKFSTPAAQCLFVACIRKAAQEPGSGRRSCDFRGSKRQAQATPLRPPPICAHSRTRAVEPLVCQAD